MEDEVLACLQSLNSSGRISFELGVRLVINEPRVEREPRVELAPFITPIRRKPATVSDDPGSGSANEFSDPEGGEGLVDELSDSNDALRDVVVDSAPRGRNEAKPHAESVAPGFEYPLYVDGNLELSVPLECPDWGFTAWATRSDGSKKISSGTVRYKTCIGVFECRQCDNVIRPELNGRKEVTPLRTNVCRLCNTESMVYKGCGVKIRYREVKGDTLVMAPNIE
jgi:hypothetical protein